MSAMQENRDHISERQSPEPPIVNTAHEGQNAFDGDLHDGEQASIENGKSNKPIETTPSKAESIQAFLTIYQSV